MEGFYWYAGQDPHWMDAALLPCQHHFDAKKCSGNGLFCLARHLGRAISLLVTVSSHLFLTSSGPRHAVGLSEARE